MEELRRVASRRWGPCAREESVTGLRLQSLDSLDRDIVATKSFQVVLIGVEDDHDDLKKRRKDSIISDLEERSEQL